MVDGIKPEDITLNEEEVIEEEAVEEGEEEASTEEDKPEDKTPKVDGIEDAAKIVAKAELDWNTLKQEYEANEGKFSEESYKAFEKIGIPKEMVDDYVSTKRAANEALAQQTVSNLAKDVGGEEALKETIQWANKNISLEEKQAYNRALEAKDLTTMKILLKSFNNQMINKEGKRPTLIEGKKSAGTSGLFNSRTEYREAMKDPRYQTDRVYRLEVIDKLNRSKAKGLF